MDKKASPSVEQRNIEKTQLELNAVTLPAIQGIREVLIYRQQQEFLEQSDELNRKLCHVRPKNDMMPPSPCFWNLWAWSCPLPVFFS